MLVAVDLQVRIAKGSKHVPCPCKFTWFAPLTAAVLNELVVPTVCTPPVIVSEPDLRILYPDVESTKTSNSKKVPNVFAVHAGKVTVNPV